MVPEGWTTKRFADVADYRAGRTPARAAPEYWMKSDDGVPWVSISDMSEFGVVSHSKEQITNVAFEKVLWREGGSSRHSTDEFQAHNRPRRHTWH